MNDNNAQAAVTYFLERAQNQDIPIGKTRLIKLIYLLDIEIYRLYQRFFTESEWIFYKFGPYSFEIEDALSRLAISEEDLPASGGKVFRKMSIESDEPMAKLDIETKAIIEKLLEEWGTSDLNELLDFVYFETEPMLGAKFKQRLDFSRIMAKKIRKEAILISDEAKAKLQKLREKLCTQIERVEISDDPYIGFPALKTISPPFLKDEMIDLSRLAGTVKIEHA